MEDRDAIDALRRFVALKGPFYGSYHPQKVNFGMEKGVVVEVRVKTEDQELKLRKNSEIK